MNVSVQMTGAAKPQAATSSDTAHTASSKALAVRQLLNAWELRVLGASATASPEELCALLETFPSLGTIPGFDLPSLSNRLAMEFPVEVAAIAQGPGARAATMPAFALGASYPPEAPAGPGYEVPIPSFDSGPAAAEVPAETSAGIDLRCQPWPIRDQGDRGTCVAFATVACREHFECSEGDTPDLSEQFLYWAIKAVIGDPWPHSDGTLLSYADKALYQVGVCPERDWPYDPNFLPHNISHNGPFTPTQSAQAAAAGRQNPQGRHLRGQVSGNAALLLGWLNDSARAVAVSLPVFEDKAAPAGSPNNWTSPLGWLFGRVLDPPPTATVSGGHAVCIVGFVPDAAEPLGGHFVFRNSWGTRWGRQLPRVGYVAPDAGYGQVSASYVDRYLWEMFQL